ncbi:uncharacterized protein KD926_006617 [Aspergillus affinis]|uniref:uncharacterized protein n=1 Tax=Aspergillus affinis TaxID=1070780 RepID=UPI0022FF104E|nr:uncharacterized protein KD926_006617 [Aspergillus affinis]KAI9041718.1 hypothetical protein KD926_006617 [Aspergillus affinis]
MNTAPPLSESHSGMRVLRIPRSDQPESSVLLRVAGSDRFSSSLDLIATEGENPFTRTVQRAQLKELRTKNYHGSDEEWAQIVWYIFGQAAESVGHVGSFHGIESSATICESDSASKELVISIRKRIEGITQRLGSVTLMQNDEQEIQLLDWCGTAIACSNALEQRCRALQDRACAAEHMVDQLNDQLQQLFGAKEQHEEQLIANLVRLLNEKKLKIRNQHRLLNTAEPDPETDPNIQTPSPLEHQARFQQNPLGKRHTRGPEDRGSEGKAVSEVETDSASDEKSSREVDEGTEGSVSDGELSAQDGVEKQHSVDTNKSSAYPVFNNVAATPPRAGLSATGCLSGEGAQGDAESAGETDDDEL